MFESAAIEHRLDKETFAREETALRERLVATQWRLHVERGFRVIILVTGADGAGKGRVIQRLYEWLDPRNLRTNAYDDPTEEERLRPRMWRYWRDLPPLGEIAVVFGSWYNEPLVRILSGKLGKSKLEAEVASINRFERMLADEHSLLLKCLLYLSPDQAEAARKSMKSGYPGRHVLEEWSSVRRSAAALPIVEQVIRRTSTAWSPWIVIPAQDARYRDITFGRTILEAMTRRLDADGTAAGPSVPALIPSLDGRNVLDALDLTQTLDDREYKERLAVAQDRLAQLTDSRKFRKRALIVVFEGNDAAGKGGTIRRVTAALDVRRFRVHPIAAPSDEEKAQPYLWRFWRRLPRKGHTAIFDRSWYGRVLVERVEGFASEYEWLRAYAEINDFESQLVQADAVLVKFWLAISPAEQLRRFEDRTNTAHKRHKITEDDWRNRERWSDYAVAVGDMIDRTSTRRAPWTLVESEDKRFGRVKVLETLCEHLARSL
jgi:polyphosphate:AMP phosphotransferase